MNTEDFVTYEQAIRLKELGFDEPCRCYYNSDHLLLCAKECELSPYTTNNRYLDEIADSMASAPTLSQAAKWLRETKRIHIFADINCVGMWFTNAIDLENNNEALLSDGEMYDSYEAALSASLDAVLFYIREKGV